LLGGAAIFGLGWGLAGLSPGTAMINFFVLESVVLFVVSMAIGQVLVDELHKRKESVGDRLHQPLLV